MGSIVPRRVRDRKTRKSYVQYWLVYYTGEKRYDEKRGKWVPKQTWEQVPAKHNTKKGAERLLRDRERAVEEGEFHPKRNMPFADLVERWKQSSRHTKPQTRYMYASLCKNHILPFFKDAPISSLGAADIEAFLTSKLDTGLSVKTVRELKALLGSIFGKAVEWEILLRNPAKVLKFRWPQQEREEIHPYNAQEVRLILEHAPQAHYAMFVMAIWTGMRQGELLAAKWANVAWNEGRYYVRENKSRNYGLQTPKSKASQAPVPLSGYVMEVLRTHKRRQEKQKKKQAERILMTPDFVDQVCFSPTKKATRSNPVSWCRYGGGSPSLRASVTRTSTTCGIPVPRF